MVTQWGPSAPHSSPSPLFGPCLLCPNGRPSQQLLSSCLVSVAWGWGLQSMEVGGHGSINRHHCCPGVSSPYHMCYSSDSVNKKIYTQRLKLTVIKRSLKSHFAIFPCKMSIINGNSNHLRVLCWYFDFFICRIDDFVG